MADMTWDEPGAWQWRCQEYDQGPRRPARKPDDTRPVRDQAAQVARTAIEEMFASSSCETTCATVEVKDPDEAVTSWECQVESSPVFVARPARPPRDG